MSRLLIEGTSVADFVTSMPRHGRSHSLIRYEETIRYAEFPVLDRSTPPQMLAQNQLRSHLERAHTEIFDMLKWLHEHGVRRIIKLRVLDRMAHPHDELAIARVVKRFRVEELDWRILDLSLNIFLPHGGPDDIPLTYVDHDKRSKGDADRGRAQKTCLTRLHLYTGGRRSALDHWFSSEGIKSMNVCLVLSLGSSPHPSSLRRADVTAGICLHSCNQGNVVKAIKAKSLSNPGCTTAKRTKQKLTS